MEILSPLLSARRQGDDWLFQVRDNYATPRVSEITAAWDVLEDEDLIEHDDMVVTVRADQDLPVSKAKQQGRRRGQAIPDPIIPDPQEPVALRDLRQAMEVRTVRRLLGLTQAQLAHKLGVSSSDIDR